jgi:YHS domain-containing protein
MDGLLSLLLFRRVVHFMMRFGCGAHMVHGHGKHAGHEHGGEARASTDRDPVCGMEVKPDQGYTKVYHGQSYRFCSRACLDKFEATPQQYAA